MSSTSGISGSSQDQSILLQLIQQLRQSQAQKTTSATGSTDTASAISQFFQSSDTDGNGELSQSELTGGFQSSGSLLSGSNLLQASATSTGDTAQDAIKALIDSIKSALQSADASSTDGTQADRKTQFQQALFKQLDGNGDGSITKDEVEGAVTKAGGTMAAADALYARLDPDNTGSVSEQQFAENLPRLHTPHGGGEKQASSSDSSSGSGSYDPLDTNQDGTVSLAERLAGLGMTLDGSASDSSSTTSTDSTNQQGLFAQLRSQTLNFLISLQSGSGESAAA